MILIPQVMKKKILDGAHGNTTEGRLLADMLSHYALYQVSYGLSRVGCCDCTQVSSQHFVTTVCSPSTVFLQGNHASRRHTIRAYRGVSSM